MQIHATTSSTATTSDTTGSRASATQKVLIVNGNSDVLQTLEPVLDAGNYDVVFVESSNHAYLQVKHVQPDLVILCVDIGDAEGLNVLSMLKLDDETRDIPVITYTSAGDTEPAEEEEEPEAPPFPHRPVLLMN